MAYTQWSTWQTKCEYQTRIIKLSLDGIFVFYYKREMFIEVLLNLPLIETLLNKNKLFNQSFAGTLVIEISILLKINFGENCGFYGRSIILLCWGNAEKQNKKFEVFYVLL